MITQSSLIAQITPNSANCIPYEASETYLKDASIPSRIRSTLELFFVIGFLLLLQEAMLEFRSILARPPIICRCSQFNLARLSSSSSKVSRSVDAFDVEAPPPVPWCASVGGFMVFFGNFCCSPSTKQSTWLANQSYYCALSAHVSQCRNISFFTFFPFCWKNWYNIITYSIILSVDHYP